MFSYAEYRNIISLVKENLPIICDDESQLLTMQDKIGSYAMTKNNMELFKNDDKKWIEQIKHQIKFHRFYVWCTLKGARDRDIN